MYSAGYGGYGNAAPNFNNGAPQQQGQQQMMYNQQQQQQQQQQQPPPQQQGQQFPGMGPQGGYPQGANPQMMAGMMQSPGMQQMPGGGQSFQQQFAGSPYGQMPSNVVQQNFAPNQYMMAGGMQGFPMNQGGGMPQQAQQQMMQRMQAQQQAQAQAQAQAHAQAQAQAHAQANAGMTPTATPQRPPSQPQGTPGPVSSQQGQFPTPQPPSQVPTPGHQQQQLPPPQQQQQQQQQQPQQQPQQQQQQQHQQPQQQHQQPQQQQQQPQSAGTATPQTPTFASNQGIPNGASSAVPLSPGTTAIENQRFTLLLDINSELLYESIQIQTSQQEAKKQRAKEASTGERPQSDLAAQKAEDTMLQQDYLHCMSRLKANLTYMAALADRKPDVKVPQSPAYLTPPNFNLTLKLRTPADNPDIKFDPAERESRAQSIKELYSRLQAAFPGVDPKKEPPRPPPPGQKPGNPPMPGQQNAMPPTTSAGVPQ